MLRAEPGTELGLNMSPLLLFLPLLAMPVGAMGSCGGAEWAVGGGGRWGMSDRSSDLPSVGLAALLLPQPHLPPAGGFRDCIQLLCASAEGGQS